MKYFDIEHTIIRRAMCLQMKFVYTVDGGMRSIFLGIDPR